MKSWSDDAHAEPDDKAAHVRAVARAEFGRKGYEVTTIRDIASAAQLGTGTVYRLIGSKDQLLASIMQSFGEKVAEGGPGCCAPNSSPIEKLDALSWVNTNVLDRFGDEFRIQLAWMRQISPGRTEYRLAVRQADTADENPSGRRHSSPARSAIDSPSNEMLARSVIGVGWIPENILHDLGTRRVTHSPRDTMLRGVTTSRA